MRAVIQRVSHARILAENKERGEIGHGFLILLGVGRDDTEEDIPWLITRLLRLKLFEGEDGRMSRDLLEVDGALAVVSQFTLLASTKKGTKPSWHRAAPPAEGERLYRLFVDSLAKSADRPVLEGVFGAMMEISLTNDGPVTIILDSKARE